MDQKSATRTIMVVIIAAALVASVGSLTALHTIPAEATKPKHNDDSDSGNSNVVNTIPSQQSQLKPLGLGISPNAGGSVGGDDFASQQAQPQAQQQAQPQPQPQAQQQAQPQPQPQAQQQAATSSS